MWRIACVAILFSCPVQAHDHSRPELNDWFMGLKSGNGPCCDTSEAISVDDPDWRLENGHYEVLMKDKWVVVPDQAVVEGVNKAGHALLWPYIHNGEPDGVRCFMPGPFA